MDHDIQKASLWKRVAAGLLDLILILILATGTAWVISLAVDYDGYNARLQQVYQDYAQEYGIDINLSAEEITALPEQQQELYRQADAAINQDNNARYLFTMVVSLMLLLVTGGILVAYIMVEWLLPLMLGNGQTVGKKVFSLCLIRNDGVKMNNLQLFVRAILGKFTVETMIPVYSVIMLIFGQGNYFILLLAVAVPIVQMILLVATRNHCLFHDLMVGTVVVDYGSQKIFKTTDDLVAYQKKLAAERAAKQDY